MAMAEELALQVGAAEGGQRLDVYIAGAADRISRSQAQKLLAEGRVTVNGSPARPSYKVNAGDRIAVAIPDPEPLTLAAEDIPLAVIYEDSDIIVIDKPRGMVVHPAAGNYTGTLVNALLRHCTDLSGINGTLRPGIVHRLDKDTTGLLVVAKNDLAHSGLTEQIKRRTVKKLYFALVTGNLRENTGLIDAPIGRSRADRKRMAVVEGGRRAVTRFRVIERFGRYTLVEAQLETGRTHQIRVHFAYIGHPVIGDPVYGTRRQPFSLVGQALHAHTLGFVHPRTGESLEFSAPLPADLAALLASLREESRADNA
jgi:23S rRNA pseudouridine1911/1915/1917 synthase